MLIFSCTGGLGDGSAVGQFEFMDGQEYQFDMSVGQGGFDVEGVLRVDERFILSTFRIFENILRGPVVEFPTQHSALRYASDGMLGQCEDLRIYSYEWYRNLFRFAGEYEPDALSVAFSPLCTGAQPFRR